MSDVALSVVLGIGLAAATGFRVFLPMLIMSGAAYTGHLPLGDSFAWLATPSALIMLSVAALAEIAAYYIPGFDNLLDTLATPGTPSKYGLIFQRASTDRSIKERSFDDSPIIMTLLLDDIARTGEDREAVAIVGRKIGRPGADDHLQQDRHIAW